MIKKLWSFEWIGSSLYNSKVSYFFIQSYSYTHWHTEVSMYTFEEGIKGSDLQRNIRSSGPIRSGDDMVSFLKKINILQNIRVNILQFSLWEKLGIILLFSKVDRRFSQISYNCMRVFNLLPWLGRQWPWPWPCSPHVFGTRWFILRNILNSFQHFKRCWWASNSSRWILILWNN